jgi:hypothetical protein
MYVSQDHAAGGVATTTSPARETMASAVLWVIVFFLISAVLQLAQPIWFDSDTAYHIAVGRLIKDHGLLRSFPWTAQSLMADRYADTELLFHLFFTATSGFAPDAASKLVGVLVETTLLATLFGILRRARVLVPGLWVLFAVAISGAFVIRFATVRPHLLSVLFSVLVLWAACERRLVVLGLCCAIFPYAHLGWPSAAVLVGIAELAHWLSGRPPSWRVPAVGLVSLGVGLVLHPNFPAVAQMAWLEVGKTLWATAWQHPRSHPIGGEFSPFTPLNIFKYMAIPMGLTAWTLVHAIRRRRTLPPMALACVLVATGYVAMTLRSQRFIEYLVPFSVLAGAVVIPIARPRRLAMVWAACACFTVWMSLPLYDLLVHRTDLFPPKTTTVLREAIPENAQVFTCDWSFTGEMMLALPNRRFLVALNPLYFYQKDPALYDVWLNTVYAPSHSPSAIVRDKFKARYVLCETLPQFSAFIAAVARDPETRHYLHEGPWWLFEI